MPTIQDFAAQAFAPTFPNDGTGKPRHLLTLTIDCESSDEALDVAARVRSMLAAPTAHKRAVDDARSDFADAVKRAGTKAELLAAATDTVDTVLRKTAPYSNPTTSRAAAQRIAPFLTKRRLEVYALILGAGSRGLEDTEAADSMGFDASRQYSPRRKELVDAGLVVDSGRTRKTPRGQDATVWVASECPDPAQVEQVMQRAEGGGASEKSAAPEPETPAVARGQNSENAGSPPSPEPAAPAVTVEGDGNVGAPRNASGKLIGPQDEPEGPRPGMDPQKALDAYDAQSDGNVAPAPTDGADFKVGGRYDGIEIVKVQTSKAQGFGVLTLNDGQKVQYDLATGHEIARKNKPPEPEGTTAMDIDIVATTRNGGAGAPKSDPPMVDQHTPEGQTPDWMVPIIEAESLKEAVSAALKRIEIGDFVDWAVSNRLKIPAFKRIQAGRFRARIERQIATIAPKTKKAREADAAAEASP